MDESFDNKIKKALEHGTDNIVDQSEEVWQAIKAQTKYLPKGARRMNRRAKRRNRLSTIITTGTVAAAVLLTFFLRTEPGKAAIDKIRELFEPQKNITQDLEGNKEETLVELEHSKMGYVLYVDKDLYSVVNEDDVDRIVAKNQGEGLPEVFMEVTQITDKAPDVVAADIDIELKAKYPIAENRGLVTDPLKGTLIRAASGGEWNDEVLVYYLIDNTKGGTFVIKQQYFVEAEEGHGARFYHMLKEFQIVEE